MKSLIVLILISVSVYGQENNIVSIGLTGDKQDAIVNTEFGLVLMGGSTDVEEAFQWMIERARGGDFVIIRASGAALYNDYIYNMGNVNSVETLLVNSRDIANLPETARILREADALFIAGGDQANYVKFWSDTEVSRAMEYLINEKKIPIGGTSAGCAVLSDIIFDALHDTVLSEVALTNPYDKKLSLSKSFIRIPYMNNIITDQHYSQRKRQGRHVAFLARMKHDMKIQAKGIAVDEKTAVCIDANGNTKIFGTNQAFFISTSKKGPEVCKPGTPLQWNRNEKALRVFIYKASKKGTQSFNILKWPSKNPDQYWYVDKGVLKIKDN